MDKKAYIISGNHDGILAAASNIKAAYRIAYAYVSSDDDANESELQTYQNVCKQIRENGWAEVGSVHDMYGCGAEILVRTLYSK